MKKLSILVTIILSLFLITSSAFPQQNPGGHNGNSILVNNTGAGGSSFTSLLDVTITSPIDGQTLRYNGTNWVNDSNLFNDGTNIGIGTVTPGGMLHVYEDDGSSVKTIIEQSGATYGELSFELTTPDVSWQFFIDDYLGADLPVGALSIWQGGVGSRLTILNTGEVGIGTTTPGGMFEIEQNGKYIRFAHTGVTAVQTIQFGTKFDLLFSNRYRFILNNDCNEDNLFLFTSDTGRGLNGSNKEQSWVSIEPKIEQSSTGAYNGLKINVLEDTIGDGTAGDGNLLLNLSIESIVKFLVDRIGNVGLRTSTFDGSAEGVLAIANGTAPAAGTANQFYTWSADNGAGNASWHLLGELGDALRYGNNILDTVSGALTLKGATTLTLDSDSGDILLTPSTGTVQVTGDIEIGSTDAFQYGDPATDTSWQTVRSGTKLSFQRRESSAWVEKGFFDMASFHSNAFHAEADAGVSGSYCWHPGTTPDANADGPRLWVDGSGDLYLLEQNADPGTKVQNKIVREDASGRVGIGTDSPYSNGFTIANSTDAHLYLQETGATTDNKLWDIIVENEKMSFNVVNDANTIAQSFLEVDRTGSTIDNITFPNGNVGIGGSFTADSIFHIKANTSGTVGDYPSGQIIIQNPADDANANVVITAYKSDVNGDPDEQLWYIGSSAGDNENITFLNRRDANLALGTNNVARLIIDGNGQIDIPGIYSETTASGANVFVASDGSLRRSTSSRKIKKNILENVDPAWALKFRPVTFREKLTNEEHVGFIAEDMRDIDPRFATDGGKDDLPGLEINAIVAALTATVQNQQKQIEELRNLIKYISNN